jgi:hypothetical protein
MKNSGNDIPEAEKIPFSQRAKRVILCGIEMAIGYDAPDSIANQRLQDASSHMKHAKNCLRHRLLPLPPASSNQ